MKVYGPYTRQDGRQHVILYDGEKRKTISYPKWKLEQYLEREIAEPETVHHIDGDFTNNNILNLEILTRKQHAKLHGEKREIEYIEFICPQCGNHGKQEARNVRHNRKLGKAGPFCSRSCAGKYSTGECPNW